MSGCLFCQRKVEQIDYKDVGAYRPLLKGDGTIRARRSRKRKKLMKPAANGKPEATKKQKKQPAGSGLCRRHQAQLAVAVKRARFMALLPLAPLAKEIKRPPGKS